ncbi:phosphate acyltransferase PlsX [Pyrinomonas methylaliphatogenes]|nr:phosphate acyltransferase PlsX [Pyrinomonas methylaliphatogenes]MBX5478600.1 phosphate acyltransferase PlsX [Pyrinomonas methylaliphatogenes]
MVRIALDAMGGDHAPQAEIDGALAAARDLGVRIALVGQPDKLEPELRRCGWHHQGDRGIEIVEAPEVVRMDEPAAIAVRRKKRSSLRVAIKLVAEGHADGFVTAGNTGAAMATAMMVLGTLPGVDRPALAALIPTRAGRPTLLLDVGANSDCKPTHLAQFAIMGDAYARAVLGIERPTVGLMSIGEEEVKGNELTKEAFALLRELEQINFVGNVEGRDVFTGAVDIIITDGFTGNVMLKLSEGLSEMMIALIRRELSASVITRTGAMLARPAFRRIKRQLDYAEIGGAPLLGVRGVVMIAHGSSSARAIRNAIRNARDFVLNAANEKIERNIATALLDRKEVSGAAVE